MTSAAPDLPRVPGYAIEAVLGSGGMATVYRGRQLTLDRPVAIKLLRAYGRDAEELNRRFEQEAKLIAALDHPNIVAIYEVMRTEAGDACYVMPLLAHGDLASRPRPVPEAEVKRVLGAILEALGHAHSKGVVHRDVKPENVLFDARGTPLLADFGVALKIESRERLTAHGRAVGSSLTMSPEQARGEVVDGRSDLYSVGCMTFEMLTGQSPFDGDDFLAVALKHQQDPVPRLPPALRHWQDFVDCALAKSPSDRYANAGAMLGALESIARAPVADSPAAAPARRRWPAVAGGAALLLALLLAWQWRPMATGGDSASAAPAQQSDAVSASIAAGNGFDGSPQSAAVLLAPQFAASVVDASALDQRDRLLDAAGKALASADASVLAAQLPNWAAFVAQTAATDTPAVRELVAKLEQRLRPALERAHDARDRSLAAAELTLAQALPAPSLEFAKLVDDLARFPASGEPFRDGDGPELLLIGAGRLSGYSAPFAVTRTEITRADYARFVQATGRANGRCRENGRAVNWRDPGFAQTEADPVVCVSYADVTAYAAWLSQRSGRAYRPLALAEWRALDQAARVGNCANLSGQNAACGDQFRATAPVAQFVAAAGMPVDLTGNVREWTQSCEYQEIGAVRRTLSNFGRWLQGKERDASGRICVGRYVAGSGWRDADSERAASSVDEDQAAVDRGFRLLREIR